MEFQRWLGFVKFDWSSNPILWYTAITSLKFTHMSSGRLISASQNGNASEVRRLVHTTKPTDFVLNKALVCAAQLGHTECVKELVAVVVRPENHANNALEAAVRNGHADCVQLLIPLFNSDVHSHGLTSAAHHGNAQCLQLFINMCDLDLRHSPALQIACQGFHDECVDILIPLSDTQYALQDLRTNHRLNPEYLHYLEHRICVQQRKHLEEAVQTPQHKAVPRKM